MLGAGLVLAALVSYFDDASATLKATMGLVGEVVIDFWKRFRMGNITEPRFKNIEVPAQTSIVTGPSVLERDVDS